jgi:nucleotide-binding universal stress UspA family protein
MTRNVIVVGYDGSPGAEAALTFALHEASARHLEVEIVNGWVLPQAAIATTGMASGAALEACEQAGSELLAAAAVRAATIAPDVTVHTCLVATSPAEALIERSADATQLVVGRRGHNGLLSALLGSVANQVAHHAACPVVLMPAEPVPA